MAIRNPAFAPVLALFGAGDNPPEGNRFSLLTILLALLRYRYLIIFAAALAAFVLAQIESRKPSTYTATVEFLLKDAPSASGSGGLLAALGGASANNASGLFLHTLRTRALLQKAVMGQYTGPNGRGVRRTPLNVSDSADTEEKITLRHAAALLNNATSTSVDGNGIVSLRVRAGDPLLAKQLTDTLLDLLNKANLDRARTRVSIERQFVRERQAQLAVELRAAEDDLQGFLMRNRDYRNSPQLNFDYERLQRAVALKQSLYNGMAEANERARIEEARNTPTLFIWEPSLIPDGPDLRTLGGRPFFGAVFVATLVALFGIYREIKRRLGGPRVNEIDELAALGREAIGDIRRPWRPIGRTVRRRPDRTVSVEPRAS